MPPFGFRSLVLHLRVNTAYRLFSHRTGQLNILARSTVVVGPSKAIVEPEIRIIPEFQAIANAALAAQQMKRGPSAAHRIKIQGLPGQTMSNSSSEIAHKLASIPHVSKKVPINVFVSGPPGEQFEKAVKIVRMAAGEVGAAWSVLRIRELHTRGRRSLAIATENIESNTELKKKLKRKALCKQMNKTVHSSKLLGMLTAVEYFKNNAPKHNLLVPKSIRQAINKIDAQSCEVHSFTSLSRRVSKLSIRLDRREGILGKKILLNLRLDLARLEMGVVFDGEQLGTNKGARINGT